MHLKIIIVVRGQRYLQLQFLEDLVIHQIPATTYRNLVDSVIHFIVFGQAHRQLRLVISIPLKLMRAPAEQRQVVGIL